MKYRAMKDFFGVGNSILFAKGATITEEDLVRQPWLQRSIFSGTIVEVPEEASKQATWHDHLMEDD
jgi:hypothetical protein